MASLRWAGAEDAAARLTLLSFSDGALGERIAPRLFGPARRWASFTPLVLVRHSKLKTERRSRDRPRCGVEGTEEPLRRNLARRDYQEKGLRSRRLRPDGCRVHS